MLKSRALRLSGFVALGALFVLSLALFRQGRGTDAPRRSPLKPLPSPLPPARPEETPAAGPPSSGIGSLVRVVRRDGTVDVFVETEATQQERFDWANRAKADYDRECGRFEAEYRRRLRDEGPAAAFQNLDRALSTPGRILTELAAHHTALKLLAEIQRDLAEGKGLYEPIRAVATGALVTLLQDPARRQDRIMALAQLGGLPLIVDSAGWPGRGEDGVSTYDLTEPPYFYVHFSPYGEEAGLRPNTTGTHPSLRVSETAEAVLRLAADSVEDGDLRSLALRALCVRPDLLDRIELRSLAANPPEDMSEAVVWALTRRPEMLTPTVFFSLIGATEDPSARSLLWKAGAERAFESPQMAGLVDRSLPIPFKEEPEDGVLGRTFTLGDRTADEKECRDQVLETVLDRYANHPDPALLEVLSRHLEEWARWTPRSENAYTPALRVLDFIYEQRWTEFDAQVRALQAVARHPRIRTEIERVLKRFDGKETDDEK